MMIPVMIVEDEFLVRIGLRSIMNWNEEGFEIVAEAQTAEEALQLFSTCHPAIVVTDIRLPGMDGISLMKELRRSDEKVSFVVLTAYENFQYAKEAISVGAINYFVKGSMDVNDFLSTLRELRNRHLYHADKEMRSQYSIQELLALPDALGFLTGDCADGEEAYLLYFQANQTDPDMLDAMILDYFQRERVRGWRLSSESGGWFLYTREPGREDDVVEALSRMLDRYVDEQIILARSNALSSYRDLKEAAYHALLDHAGGRKPPADPDSCLRQVLRLETRLQEEINLSKNDEIRNILEELWSHLIQSRSPRMLFKCLYRVLGVFEQNDKDIAPGAAYEALTGSLDLAHIFQQLEAMANGLRERDGRQSGIECAYVKKVKEYVNRNYQKPIRVQELADAIHVSPNYLGRIFYANTNEHLRSYINVVKIEKAKELLRAKEHKVSEVARMVGIDDQQYFSKVFRRYTGISPTEYGKNGE